MTQTDTNTSEQPHEHHDSAKMFVDLDEYIQAASEKHYADTSIGDFEARKQEARHDAGKKAIDMLMSTPVKDIRIFVALLAGQIAEDKMIHLELPTALENDIYERRKKLLEAIK